VLTSRSQVYAEGTHLMVPWFERPIIYDVRAQPNIVQSTSGSRDLQMVLPRAPREPPLGLTPPPRRASGEHQPARADPASGGEAARDLPHAGGGLERAGAPLHRPGDAEERGGPVQRQPAHHAAGDGVA
jgi:hypothetical protein